MIREKKLGEMNKSTSNSTVFTEEELWFIKNATERVCLEGLTEEQKEIVNSVKRKASYKIRRLRMTMGYKGEDAK